MARRTKQRALVTTDKRPRWLPTVKPGQISISFVLFDDTSWCAEYDEGSYFAAVAKKIKQYESMQWMDIVSRDHRVVLGKLITKAMKRLVELRLDDVDELWRFQLNGLKRLWGVRFGSCFYVLWWDPRHVICPSKLQNT